MLALFGNLECAGLPPSFGEELAWRLFHNHPTAASRPRASRGQPAHSKGSLLNRYVGSHFA